MVGLTVLIALLVLTWMILVFAGRATALFVESGRVEVTIRTDRADGVNSGSNVFYRGVNVGQVTGVRRDADNLHIELQAN